MYVLKIARASRYEHPIITTKTLEELRDQLVFAAEEYGLDTVGWEDLHYTVSPWDIDEDDPAPRIRPLTPELLVAFAAHVFDTSPKHVQLAAATVDGMVLAELILATAKLHELEAEISTMREKRIQLIKDAYQDGHPPTKIGQAADVSRSFVHRIVKEDQ